MKVLAKRFQQTVYELAANSTRLQGSASGSGISLDSPGFAAAGSQGNYSTANNATWTDITNTTFTMQISRPAPFIYFYAAAARLSAGGALGYVRGNIVGFDTTAAIEYGSTSSVTSMLWYMGLVGQGPLQPGSYTVKLQASTDNNSFNLVIDNFFHNILLLG